MSADFRKRYTLQEDGTCWVTDCAVGATQITIPAVYSGIAVTGIGANAFENCAWLEEIVIPEGITELGDSAFAYCIGLESVTFPSTATTLGNTLFNSCISLRSADMSACAVTSVPAKMFQGCIALNDVHFSGKEDTINSLFGSKIINRMDGTSNVFIYGLTGSTSESFAETNGYTFVSTGVYEEPSDLGDLNGDGEVNASDLTILARHVGKVETIEDSTYLANADVTGDGEVDASDLTRLAQYVGKIISSLD